VTRTPELAIFALALLVRIVHLAGMDSSPTAGLPIMDAADYDQLARSLLGQGSASTPLFWQAPFYPLVLGGLYALSGGSLLAVQLVQIVLGSLTAALTVRLGRGIGGARVGTVAGIVVALYGPLVFYDGELLATSWAAFLTVTGLLVLLRVRERPDTRRGLVFGLVLALGVITRPPLLLAWVGATLWLLLLDRRVCAAGGAARWRLAGALLAGFLAITVPVSALNTSRTGHFGFLPATGGLNVHIGNNPEAETTIALRPGAEWTALAGEAKSKGVTGGMYAEQEYYYAKALRFVREEPGTFLTGLGRKALRFMSAREIPRSVDIYTFREWSSVLRVLVWKVGGFGFPFGALLPLAVVGLVVAVRTARSRGGAAPVGAVPTSLTASGPSGTATDAPGATADGTSLDALAPLLLVVLLYAASIVLVFDAARYRAPIVPLLAVPAAVGLLAIVRAVRGRSIRDSVGLLAVMAPVVALIVVPGPYREEALDYRAETQKFVANRYWVRGEPGRAVVHYREALSTSPADPVLHAELGEALVRVGETAAGIEHYRRSLALEPRAGTHNLLAAALLGAGQAPAALAELERALALRPDYVEAHVNHGVALQQTGRAGEAVTAYERALALGGEESPGVRHNLGSAYLATGRTNDALRVLERAVVAHPEAPDTRYLLAAALARVGEVDRARHELREVLRRAPGHPLARQLLARLEAAVAPETPDSGRAK
jgi:tetratricopeptide (TPR) repeat protein